MKLELFISWRYLVTKRKEKFISLISLISVLGVAIGVAALIIVIAVMTGFDNDLRDKIVGNYSHIVISGNDLLSKQAYDELVKKVASNPHVRGISPNIDGQVLIREANRYFVIKLRGIDPLTESTVSQLDQYLLFGSLNKLDKDSVIIGKELAAYLGAGLNSNLKIFAPTGKQYTLKIAGIFKSGMYEYDASLGFCDIKTAQEIFAMPDKFMSVAIKLDDIFLADQVREELSNALGYNYNLRTWSEIMPNFFAALKLEKFVMFVLLTLIILVASFNIISMLIVLVKDKTKDVGILKALGINSKQIRNIFALEGIIIGGLGTLSGAGLGIFLCALLKKYQFIKLPADTYYLDRLPVAIELWPDIVLIILAAMAITIAAAVYPAIKAGKLKTIEALRYE